MTLSFSVIDVLQSPCTQLLSLVLCSRYFRPNEGHLVQGLAPGGCLYLAGDHAQHAIIACTTLQSVLKD